MGGHANGSSLLFRSTSQASREIRALNKKPVFYSCFANKRCAIQAWLRRRDQHLTQSVDVERVDHAVADRHVDSLVYLILDCCAPPHPPLSTCIMSYYRGYYSGSTAPLTLSFTGALGAVFPEGTHG